jgi:hypothetical protein
MQRAIFPKLFSFVYDYRMTTQQKKEWDEAIQAVHQLTDRLGKPVHTGFIETVAVMRLLGINTIRSYEGHMSGTVHGPYILCASSEAMVLWEQLRSTPENDTETIAELKHTATLLNILERDKLVQFLDLFYDKRLVPFNQRLVIMSIGPLKFSYLYCQGAERAYGVDENIQQEILTTSRHEMQDFTEFLKKIYFTIKI